jgi:hypothetical protein
MEITETSASKKDIILLHGKAELQIDMIGRLLLRMFEDYEYFPKKYFGRLNNISEFEIIDQYVQNDDKLIANTISYYPVPWAFKVFFIGSTEDQALVPPTCNLVIRFDEKKPLAEEEILTRIIVTWSYWQDDRKKAQPI